MNEDLSIADVIAKLRQIAKIEVQRCEELVLRFDITQLMVARQEDFDEGWPHHDLMIRAWPDCN